MSEKMRDDFFEWYYQQEQFGDAHQEELWKAWQASRAALWVELPVNCKGMALTVDELRTMLGEIGVTLK